MSGKEWLENLPCSVMICDSGYKILYMNAKAIKDHADDGGRNLVGSSLMDCHPPDAQRKLRKVLSSAKPNIYISQKLGTRKLVYQCQWRKDSQVGGLVQFVIELPGELPGIARTRVG